VPQLRMPTTARYCRQWLARRIQFRKAEETQVRILAARIRPSCARTASPSEKQRAQGMPGARCARSRVWSVESTRVSHHGHTGITRHSPRNGFTAYIALSRVTGLSCHPRRRSRVHRIPCPTSVTIAKRPSGGPERRANSHRCERMGNEIFFPAGLDHPNQIESFQQIRVYAQRFSSLQSGRAKRPPGQIIQLICPAG
jgi:hypothetical protein